MAAELYGAPATNSDLARIVGFTHAHWGGRISLVNPLPLVRALHAQPSLLTYAMLVTNRSTHQLISRRAEGAWEALEAVLCCLWPDTPSEYSLAQQPFQCTPCRRPMGVLRY